MKELGLTPTFPQTEKVEHSEPVASIFERPTSPESIEQLAVAKLWAATALSKHFLASINQKRIINQDLIGRMLYGGLYYPDGWEEPIQQFIAAEEQLQKDPASIPLQEMPRHEGMWKDIAILKETFPSALHIAQSREEFVAQFRKTISSHHLPEQGELAGRSYAETIYFPGAHEVLRVMAELGPTRIWTAGDVEGIKELGLQGSAEQLQRAAQGGLLDLREELNVAAGQPVFDILAHEDKSTLLPAITHEYRNIGVSHVVVIDDKSTNLVEAKRIITANDPEYQGSVLTILDQQGSGGPASERKEVHPDFSGPKVKDIRNVLPVVYEYFTGQPLEPESDVRVIKKELQAKGIALGWIVDHDDVVSDNSKAKELLGVNLVAFLRDQGIIAPKPAPSTEDEQVSHAEESIALTE